MRDKVLAVFKTYSEGGSCRKARETAGISSAVFYDALAKNPELDTQYRTIQASRADMSVDRMLELADECSRTKEDLLADIVAWKAEGLTDDQIAVLIEPRDPRRVRVAMDGFRAGAELYDRKRYGQRVAVDTEVKVSLLDAITTARTRALRPPCDPANIIDAEYTAIPMVSASDASDCQSEATVNVPGADDIDPFAP